MSLFVALVDLHAQSLHVLLHMLDDNSRGCSGTANALRETIFPHVRISTELPGSPRSACLKRTDGRISPLKVYITTIQKTVCG